MFQDIFEHNSKTRILDFLADYPRFDYSIKEIAEKAETSRPIVYKVIKILQDKKFIIKTRDQGNSSRYKINTENKLVQVILKFDFEIASKEAEIESKDTVKKYKSVLTGSKTKVTAV